MGGMVFMRQMLDKMGFRKVVTVQPAPPVSGSNRGYSSSTIVEAFLVGIWRCVKRLLQTEVTQYDRHGK